jgi:hypothetical protein
MMILSAGISFPQRSAIPRATGRAMNFNILAPTAVAQTSAEAISAATASSSLPFTARILYTLNVSYLSPDVTYIG